jgi:hypothetical protein
MACAQEDLNLAPRVHRDVLLAVAVEIADHHRVRGAVKGQGWPSAEGAVAVVQQDGCSAASASRHEIGFAVAVEELGKSELTAFVLPFIPLFPGPSEQLAFLPVRAYRDLGACIGGCFRHTEELLLPYGVATSI